MYEEYDEEEFGGDDYGYDDEDAPYHRHHIWSSHDDAERLESEFEKYDGLSTPSQLVHNCIEPTFLSASGQLAETLALCFLYRALVSIDRIKSNPLYRNYLNVLIGLCILYRYFHTLIIYVCVYSVCLTCVLCACKRSRHLFYIVLSVSIVTITVCEYTFVHFIQIRSVFMLMSAKILALTVDFSRSNFPLSFDVLGYLFNPGTVLFGPFVTYEQYVNSVTVKSTTTGNGHGGGFSIRTQIWSAVKHLMCAAVFLLCTCLVMIFPTYSSRSLYMYRDALSFRVSHYFISALSVCTFVICGYEWFGSRTDGASGGGGGKMKRRRSVSADEDELEEHKVDGCEDGHKDEDGLANEKDLNGKVEEIKSQSGGEKSVGSRLRLNRNKDKSKNRGGGDGSTTGSNRKGRSTDLNKNQSGDHGASSGMSDTANFYEMVSNPFYIEIPYSLKNVVFHWNRPLSFFLNQYIYRRFCETERKNLNRSFYSKNKFMRLFLTYLVSCGLHGFNVDICVILLSLSVYSYVEFELRAKLSSTFSACVGSCACVSSRAKSRTHAAASAREEDCGHAHKATSVLSMCVNALFVALNVYHLAYLGCLMNDNQFREPWMIVYFLLPLKWVHAGFASHYIVLAQYLFYILI